MSDQTARRVTITHQAIRNMPHQDLMVARAADIPDTFARRHAVLGQHCGAVGYALATGCDDALCAALLAVHAASGAWLATIEDERAR